MTFAYGLGTNNMRSQYNQDSSVFKIQDISKNIQKYNTAGGNLSSATYVDYTAGHLNRSMNLDQENDNHATFLFEYQALLRSRMQQMITELTSALTRDLDRALIDQRKDWNADGARPAAQGLTSDVEDAGAARVAYNFLTGFAAGVDSAGDPDGLANGQPGSIDTGPYTGIPTYDSYTGTTVDKVSPDTSADALFWSSRGATLRSAGTATIQQTFPEDNLDEAVIDELVVGHNNTDVLYHNIGGGFISGQNRYKFTNVTGVSSSSINRYDAQNIGFLNNSIADDTGGTTQQGGNLNDEDWDNATPTPGGKPDITYELFNQTGNVKNEFERVLYDTIFELDQRNLLRDVFRLSEKDGFLNGVQIASTSSLVTGSQAQASLRIEYVPFYDGSATDTNDVDGDGNTAESRGHDRADLGGSIHVIMDHCSAFYHS